MQQILRAEKEDDEGNLRRTQIAPTKPKSSRRPRQNKGKEPPLSTADTEREDEGDDAFTPTLEDHSEDELGSDDDEPEIITNAEVYLILLLSCCC